MLATLVSGHVQSCFIINVIVTLLLCYRRYRYRRLLSWRYRDVIVTLSLRYRRYRHRHHRYHDVIVTLS